MNTSKMNQALKAFNATLRRDASRILVEEFERAEGITPAQPPACVLDEIISITMAIPECAQSRLHWRAQVRRYVRATLLHQDN